MQPIARQGEQFNLHGESFPHRHEVSEEPLRGFLGGRSIQAGYNNRRQAEAYPSRTAGWGSPSPEDYDDTGDEAAWDEDQQGLGLHQLGEPPQHHQHPDELHEGPHDPYDEHGSLGVFFSPHEAPPSGGGLGGGYDDYDHGLSAHEAEFG